MSKDPEFDSLISACTDIAEGFPEGLMFIGGIAVYLHSLHHKETEHLAETTHDADVYISLVDLADLRETEELTPNRRLSKHQMIKRGFEFDIYTERQSNLKVPYDEVLAHSKTYDMFRVASLEHLLVLKLAAYQDRKGSVKGEKDARDIVRIAAVMSLRHTPIQTDLITPYLNSDDISLLQSIIKTPAAVTLASGNVHEAKAFRSHLENLIASITKSQSTPPRPKVR